MPFNYSDLQSALAEVQGLNWPSAPQAGTFPIAPVTGASPAASLAALQTAFGTFSGGQSFDFAPTDLPACLPLSFANALDTALTINALSVSVGPSSNGVVPVNAIAITLELAGVTPFYIDSLHVTDMQVELNLVCLGNALAWNMAFSATGSWQTITCTASISVVDWVLTVELQDSPDQLLGAFDSGTTLASLMQSLGLTQSGTAPATATLVVSAALSAAARTYNGSLALDGISLTGHGLTLDNIAVALAYSPGTPSSCTFSIEAEATIGQVTIEGMLSNQSGTVTFVGMAWCAGLSITDFLTDLFTQLDLETPSNLPDLPDVELTALSLTLTDASFQALCEGAIVLDALGTSFAFGFSASYSAAAGLAMQLQLDDLSLGLSTVSGTTVFSTSTAASLSLGSLIRLARLEALYGIADGITIDMTAVALVFVPPASGTGPNHILFGVQFSPGGSLQNPILGFITNGNSLGISSATLFVANAPWSAGDLSGITGQLTGFQLPSSVPQGPSFAATLALGGSTTYMPLTPSGQQPAGSSADGSSAPPAPLAVTSSSAARWFDVQKQLGPIYLDRTGVALGNTADGDHRVDVLCDGAFMLGPLTLDLVGFSLGFPLVQGFSASSVSVSLQGMNIAYSKPPLTISGGLLHTTDSAGNDLYAGDATVQTQTLLLSAAGEYASDSAGNTSLAMFAVLNDPPLGGPVFCYVTGLAAGFGYNSHLNIPATASAVPQFALVSAAVPPSPGTTPPDPMTVITSSVTPAAGDDWLAVGLLFRSFELVQSTALLTAAFGPEFQLAVLGQSELSIPPASTERIAYAQVDVEATYSPGAGALEVFGVLTPSSYVLSPDCHLSGGFAYILRSSGDFVATFGGYAPTYDYAARGYPAVPRLQMSWRVDDHTSIKGSEYFALTPAVMMAGGSLQATWDCGIFSAWFTAEVDVFMQWKPFSYQGGFSMSLGVGFDLRIWFVHVHFTFHVGASLQVAGPPFHGSAHIDLSVISFTVSFGPSPGTPPSLDWTQFRAMLPGDAANDASQSALLSTRVAGGLVKDLSQTSPAGNDQPDWVVNGSHFSFAIQSSIPVTQASSGTAVSITLTPEAVTTGILPMNITSATGTLDVTLTHVASGNVHSAGTDPTSPLVASLLNADMAPAHWGTSAPADTNVSTLTATCGYQLSAGRPTPDRTVPVLVSTLLSTPTPITAISTRTPSTTPF